MLKLHNVSHSYVHNGSLVTALENISLTVERGEFVAFIGPSGCGKTTLLKLIAGLIRPTSGSMLLNGKAITSPGKDRGMVFQQYSLFPWLTVKDNIAFGLELKNTQSERFESIPHISRSLLMGGEYQYRSREKIDRIVNHYLSLTGLIDFKDAYPKALSGGMQQRVAIARTLAVNPDILLMDEPFGSLDALTRGKMQEFLLDLRQRERKTILFVTHDVEEAAFLADRVCIMTPRPGRIQQEVPMSFPRPRRQELRFTPGFQSLAKDISSKLSHALDRVRS